MPRQVQFQLGPAQCVLLQTKAQIFLWESARGAAKSFAGLLDDHEICVNVPNSRSIWYRRNLSEINTTLLPGFEKVLAIMGTEKSWTITHGNTPTATYKPNGSRIVFNAAETVEHVGRTQGSNFPRIRIDEPQNIQTEVLTRIFAVGRSTTTDAPTQIFLLANPGGISHAWLRRSFIVPARAVSADGNVPHPDWINPVYGDVVRCPDDWRHWKYDLDIGEITGTKGLPPVSVEVIVSGVTQNPALRYKEYQAGLSFLSPMMRRAWIQGDPDVEIGQFFPEVASWLGENLSNEPLDRVVVGIDPGMRKTAVVWGAYDIDQQCDVFDEQFFLERSVDYIVPELEARAVVHGLEPKSVVWVMDPAGESRNPIDARRLTDEYRLRGIPVVTAREDKKGGWQIIRARGNSGKLRIDQRKCPILFNSLVSLQSKDTDPDDVRKDPGSDGGQDGDHSADALRYLETFALFHGSRGKTEEQKLIERLRAIDPNLLRGTAYEEGAI